jgi:hypothetical protein
MGFDKDQLRTVFALIATLVAGWAIIGCGGGSSTAAVTQDPGDGPVITKAALIRQGDAICRRTDEIQRARLVSWERKHPQASLIYAKVQERALIFAAIPPLGSEIKSIADLGIPRGDKATVEPILDGWQAALKEIERKPSLLLEGGEGPFTEPDALAKKYGFKACAKAL